MHSPTMSPALRGLAILCGMAVLLGLIRWDRSTRTVDLAANDRPAIKAAPPGAAAPFNRAGAGGAAVAPLQPQPAVVEAEKSLRELEDRLVEARDELNRVTGKLEEKQRALADADKAAAANQRPVAVPARDEERERLEKEVADLKKQVADSDATIKAIEENRKQAKAAAPPDAKVQRPAAVPPKPVDPNSLGRGRIVDQQTKFDPRRFRDPAMPRFVPNAAAVAAAGSAGAARGGGGFNFPGATAFGDIARGQAEFVRASGESNLNNSKAMINAQTAKAMALDNKLAFTETFFENRRINRAARALEAGPRPTTEQIVQYARMQAPRRLSSLELDPLTGDITWPRALTDKPYKRHCDFIEEQFQLRAKTGGSTDFAQFEVFDAALASLTESLQENVRKYRVSDYGKAKNFLESLKVEFDLPLQ